MSFSQDVKNEILRHRISKPCCSVAAAYAVACFGKYFDDRGIVLQTENEGVAAFAQKLVEIGQARNIVAKSFELFCLILLSILCIRRNCRAADNHCERKHDAKN